MIVIKSSLGDDLRRFSFSPSSSFQELVTTLESLYNTSITEKAIHYIDDEGDRIRITCTIELQEACRNRTTPLRIYLDVKLLPPISPTPDVTCASGTTIETTQQVIKIQGRVYSQAKEVNLAGIGCTKVKENTTPATPPKPIPRDMNTTRRRISDVCKDLSNELLQLNASSTKSAMDDYEAVSGQAASACLSWTEDWLKEMKVRTGLSSLSRYLLSTGTVPVRLPCSTKFCADEFLSGIVRRNEKDDGSS
eukprot:TRINITY_DN5419_c0_g2_i1.p1 TRINITY_DN5419_c0_g2~~TRINITY_DN5419_c0_g2_i1.p1  ORF type:complete len:250 (-),score=27.75 TRINITY_DN5419_c0_g2_i1:284-1033(-)